MKRGLALVAVAAILIAANPTGPTAYDKQQDARIAALEAALASPTPTPTPAVAPAPTPSPTPALNVAPCCSSQSAFLALLGDNGVDVIEIAAGTYRGWHVYARVNRTRPVVVRPKGDVIWDDTGGSTGMGLFYFGANVGLPGYPTSPTTDIAFDPTGGSFTINGYTIGQTGLIYTGWVERIRLDGFRVRNSTGNGSASTSHALYVSSDDTHRSKSISANGWDVAATKLLNGVQTYHAPSVDGLSLTNWTITGCNRAAYLWSDPTSVVVDGWSITGCNATMDTYESSAGVVRNSRATSSGPMAPGQGWWLNRGITDGGGLVVG